jgi:hypothetical protein
MNDSTSDTEMGLAPDCLQTRLGFGANSSIATRHLLDCPACAEWALRTNTLHQAIRSLPPKGAPDRLLKVIARAQGRQTGWPFRIDQPHSTVPDPLHQGISRRAKGRIQAVRKISVAAGILAALLLVSVGMWFGRHQAMALRVNQPVLDAPARLAALLELTRSCSDEVEKLVRTGPTDNLNRGGEVVLERLPINRTAAELERLAIALKMLAPRLLDAARALPDERRKESLAGLASDWQRQESLYLRLASDHNGPKNQLQDLARIAKAAREEALREHALI